MQQQQTCGNPTLQEVFYDNGSRAHMLHMHPERLELLYIAGGSGHLCVGNNWYFVHKGNFVVCNAQTLHGQDPEQQVWLPTYCVAITGVQLPELPSDWLIDSGRNPVIEMPEDTAWLAREWIQSLYVFFQEPERDVALCQACMLTLFHLVWRELRRREEPDGPYPQREIPILRQIFFYLDAHYREKVFLMDIAQKLNVSESHVSHTFRRTTGMSPMQYVLYRRIGDAQSMLAETDEPIHEIEVKLGFGSSCHFSATFRKYIGISPSEYRKQFRKDN